MNNGKKNKRGEKYRREKFFEDYTVEVLIFFLKNFVDNEIEEKTT